jgi:putative DNA primase/helicase
MSPVAQNMTTTPTAPTAPTTPTAGNGPADLDAVLSRLDRVRRTGNGYEARCPAHEDRTASLSIGIGDDGRILVYCHASCTTEAVMSAINMEMKDLMPRRQSRRSNGRGYKPRVFATPQGLVRYYLDGLAKKHGGQAKLAATWKYDTFHVLRFDLPTPAGEKQRKEFRPVHQVPLGTSGSVGWQGGYPSGLRPLYRRHELEAAHPDLITIHGGEKAADAAHGLGLTATTNAGGEKAIDKTDWAPVLRFTRIAIVVDNDTAGEKFGQTMTSKVIAMKPDADVRIIRLPDLPPKGDIVEWIAAGGTLERFIELTETTEAVPKKQADEWRSAPKSSTTVRAGESDLPSIAYPHGQTDAAHAARFVDEYHRELLYIPEWRKWLSWDGSRWADDSGVGVLQRAKRYGQSLWADIGKIAPYVDRDDLAKVVTAIKHANQTGKIRSFLELAAVDERIVCHVNELNADPMLLNLTTGTMDLEAGKLRPHNPADRITQLANVAWDSTATCPQWERTLSLAFNGDNDLVRYVQKLLGYSISGDTGEHILPIAWGKGCNGKSTIWNVVTDILGEYATLANDDLLLGEKSNHPTEKATLYQKRFVAISEPERNSSLREARVKELTGDRQITARRMHEDFWTFHRTHTFWLSTNHLPRIDGTDDGIWRRVKLLPFTVDLRTVVEPIPDYDVWLVQNEGRGILAWLVRGFLAYRAEGLRAPECVTAATGKYRDDSDPLGDFLAEHCIDDPQGTVVASDLYRVYAEHGGKWSKTAFGRAVGERYEKDRPKGGEHRDKTLYRGLRLINDIWDMDFEKTPGKTGLGTVGHSLVSPRMNLANPIEDQNNCAQPCPNGTGTTCNHNDPSVWIHQDGNAFCPGCNRYMGRVQQRPLTEGTPS